MSDDNGDSHEVWFLDAATLFNQVKVTDAWKPRGYGLWRMGMEDPGVWSVLGKPYGQASAAGLTRIPAAASVDFDGGGEVLRVANLPTPGKRSLAFDPDTGLISDQTYDVLPSSYVIERYGQKPGLVALTFDDGPDARWTPKILDILKAKNAPATFFVIGENMQTRPDLVKREVAEGHDVGSHTWTHPNIGETPIAQTDVELNATQRLFEVITGRSMRLFRPPFFGDAEPSTPHEVAPLVIAQELGYLIVGLRIDTDDWQKPTPQTIIDRTLERLDHPGDRPGQVVLLHDAGGDRSRTVAALPGLIDAIRARGYRLVTVGELAGMTPAQAMPVSDRDPGGPGPGPRRLRPVPRPEDLLTALFITAIALGLARLVFLAGLALVHRWTHQSPENLDPETGPLVSVLIPCFNEEKVIAASVARILESEWKNIEVLVLDDGSKDGTAEAVRRAHGDNPRVTLLSFENGGKARAVNRGLAVAKGEYVVALDADTLFPPKTIGRLVRWFQDPTIGAVAGNAIVGNRLNMVTRWQALEYVTAQNLERRALAALGAVTVVPGAVGAWRKSVLDDLGGYPSDTLAEDQDLTIACQRAGWKVAFDPAGPGLHRGPRHRRRPAQAALPLVVRHPAVRLEAPRGAVQSQDPGPGLRGPAADLAVPDPAGRRRAAGRPGGGLEPDLGPLRRHRPPGGVVARRHDPRPALLGGVHPGRPVGRRPGHGPGEARALGRPAVPARPALRLSAADVLRGGQIGADRRPWRARGLGKAGAAGDRDGQVEGLGPGGRHPSYPASGGRLPDQDPRLGSPAGVRPAPGMVSYDKAVIRSRASGSGTFFAR
jgi:peptidoglycan/xylan/chitin deacetylase (PgdA/CDA1 family)/GT2 family glycosyltransferase